jgi:hypothetical protein
MNSKPYGAAGAIDSVAATATHDVVQVIRAAKGVRMAKMWCADGKVLAYDKAKQVAAEKLHVVNDLRDLYNLLARLESEPQACIVRGVYPHGDPATAQRLSRLVERETRLNEGFTLRKGFTLRRGELFVDRAHHWLMIDLDTFTPSVDPGTDTAGACIEAVRAVLPPEFHDVSFIFQLSGSAGHPTAGGKLKAHLFFWLDRPHASADLHAWATGARLRIDTSVFQVTQPHYTAAPVLDAGLADPLHGRRLGFVQGMLDDVVRLRIDPAVVAQAKQRRAEADKPMKDPRESTSPLVAAFCTVFQPDDLADLLPSHFERSGREDHFNMLGHESPDGVFIGGGGHGLVVTHSTLQGRHNVFDLVRLRLFGVDDERCGTADLDAGMQEGMPLSKLPSYRAMLAWIKGDELGKDYPEGAPDRHERFDEVAELFDTYSAEKREQAVMDDFGDFDDDDDEGDVRPSGTSAPAPEVTSTSSETADAAPSAATAGTDSAGAAPAAISSDAGQAPAEKQEKPGKSRAAPLQLWTIGDLRYRPAPKWLVRGWIPQTGCGVLFGPSNAGKSFAALDLALAVARGTEWHGIPADKGAALYIACEGSHGFAGRTQAYEVHHGADLRGAAFALIGEALDFRNGMQDAARVVDAAKSFSASTGQPVRLIVVDTLARVLSSGDENSSADVGAVIAAMDRIAKRTGAFVLGLHHVGKDATRGARGHSSLRAAMDTMIELKDGQTKTLSLDKQRDGTTDLRLAFRLEPVQIGVDVETDQPITNVVAVPVRASSAAAADWEREQRAKPRRAPNEDLVRGALTDLNSRGEVAPRRGTLLDEAEKRAAAAAAERGEKPPRKDNLARALDQLLKDGTFAHVGGDRIAAAADLLPGDVLLQ